MNKFLFALALTVPGAALAQEVVALKSTVYVARAVTDAQGNKKNQLFAPDRVLPGEALVMMLEYKNNGAKPAANFVINNPIPNAVAFTGVEQPWAVVSVDGGKTFGNASVVDRRDRSANTTRFNRPSSRRAEGAMRAPLPNCAEFAMVTSSARDTGWPSMR